MAQANITQFDKSFIDNLKGNTPTLRCLEIREQEEHAGINRALYMYQTLGSDTQQKPDGTISSPIPVAVNTIQAQVGEFGDFSTVSAFGQYSALDDATLSTSKELAYAAAQTIDLLAQNVADTLNTIDTSVLNQITTGTALDLGTLRGAKQSLVYRKVQAVRGGKMCGTICPLVLGDLWNGTTINNAAVDFWKYTEGGQDKFNDMAGSEQDEVIELPGTSLVLYQSSFVHQTPNLHSSSTGFRTYIYGHQGVIAIFARVPGDTNVDSADYRSIKVNVTRNLQPTSFDPLATIGNIAGYRFHVAFSTPPDTTMRARQIDSVSAYS